jgi:hypothetical protein
VEIRPRGLRCRCLAAAGSALGINLREVRVVGDEETAIVDALNALRHRYTYVGALAILHEWLKATGAEMSEARMRMTRIPLRRVQQRARHGAKSRTQARA